MTSPAARCMPRYWLTRLYLAAGVLANGYITANEPQALAHEVIARTGTPGWVCVAALMAIALLALADVVINDLLPPGYTLARARDLRHLIYMAMALGLVSVSGVVVASEGWTSLVLRYWLDAAVAVGVAFFDLFSRHAARQPSSHAPGEGAAAS